jgi:hypothetical protein
MLKLQISISSSLNLTTGEKLIHSAFKFQFQLRLVTETAHHRMLSLPSELSRIRFAKLLIKQFSCLHKKSSIATKTNRDVMVVTLTKSFSGVKRKVLSLKIAMNILVKKLNVKSTTSKPTNADLKTPFTRSTISALLSKTKTLSVNFIKMVQLLLKCSHTPIS